MVTGAAALLLEKYQLVRRGPVLRLDARRGDDHGDEEDRSAQPLGFDAHLQHRAHYAAADLNSSSMIFTVLASDIGITSPTQKFRFSGYSFDNYFTGDLTDAITDMTHTLGTPKYASVLGDSLGVPVGFSGALPVSAPAGGAAASPSQSGLLLLYRDAKSKRESDLVTITP